jgi:hypothetical protein
MTFPLAIWMEVELIQVEGVGLFLIGQISNVPFAMENHLVDGTGIIKEFDGEPILHHLVPSPYAFHMRPHHKVVDEHNEVRIRGDQWAIP